MPAESITQHLVAGIPAALWGLAFAMLSVACAEGWRRRAYRAALARLAHLAPPVAAREVLDDHKLQFRANLGHLIVLTLLFTTSIAVLLLVFSGASSAPQ